MAQSLADRWRALNREHSRVLGALDRALEREHRVSACELDVLQRLAAAPDASLRIQDLCESVERSHSTLSRMVGRLEAEGLVARSVYAGDRRGVAVTLVSGARQRIKAAERTQERVLGETLAAS